MKGLYRVIGVLIVGIVALIFYLYFATKSIETNLHTNLKQLYIIHIQKVASSIDELLKKYIKNDPYTTLKKDPKLREFLQDALSLTAIKPHKYVYVLYRDKKGRYRYLLDGSKEDRGEFGQKLDVNTKVWDGVYFTKKPRLFYHRDQTTLAITYLLPFIYHDKTAAIIAIDFTSDLPKTINSILYPIQEIFKYIFLLFIALLLLISYQFFIYIKTKRDSILDPLTRIYNRTFLRDFLKTFDPNQYSILMLDIDHFKKINDTYGHKAGDFILREFANTIKKILREDDIFVRYGGEEFIIFIKRPASDKAVVKIAQRIKNTFEKASFIYNGTQINFTVSIGVLFHPQKFKTFKEALKIADTLLYRAKRGGRNKIVTEDELERSMNKRDIDITFVKEAIEQGNIFCQYQPIVDMQTRKIIKYEALVRLKDTKGNIIYPGIFLSQIAFTTVYNSLTKAVIQIVFEKIKEKRVGISINLNFSDILDNTVYKIIIEQIKSNQNLAKFLTIELLENEPILQTELIVHRLQELQHYGIHITIDDFGSGFSNFAIFKHLPIDILKIDGSLIKEIEKSHISYSIVKSISLFAKDLDIKVIAEFVENEEIVAILQKLGITYAQGYYFGKPSSL